MKGTDKMINKIELILNRVEIKTINTNFELSTVQFSRCIMIKNTIKRLLRVENQNIEIRTLSIYHIQS